MGPVVRGPLLHEVCYNTLMITYYTDGSAEPNPGPGGFAIIRDGQPYIIGGEPDGSPVQSTRTTNIRMEGLAILNAICDGAETGDQFKIVTDSMFWVNVLEQWAPNWERAGWVKKGGIKNLDIVKPLYQAYRGCASRLQLEWTRGHVGTELNELADQWAGKARQMKLANPIKVSELS